MKFLAFVSFQYLREINQLPKLHVLLSCVQKCVLTAATNQRLQGTNSHKYALKSVSLFIVCMYCMSCLCFITYFTFVQYISSCIVDADMFVVHINKFARMNVYVPYI